MSKTGMGLGASIVSNNILKNKAYQSWYAYIKTFIYFQY